MKMYMLNADYNPTAYENIKTWARVRPLFNKDLVVSFDRLVKAALGHDRTDGGRGFILYLIRRKNLRLSPFAR